MVVGDQEGPEEGITFSSVNSGSRNSFLPQAWNLKVCMHYEIYEICVPVQTIPMQATLLLSI